MRHGRTKPGRTARIRGRSGVKKFLGRLGIRGKLNLLLLPPLAAVLLVSVPFVVMQAGSARSAGQTADVARQAEQLGGLIWQLQRERLLTAAYVASPSAGDGDMTRQRRTVDSTVNEVRAALGPDAPDELAAALVRIGSLQELRQNAVRRGVSLDGVARTYHAVIGAVIDSLRLTAQTTGDADGNRQLSALEALLRANEENSLRGMALIVSAVSPEAGRTVLGDATFQGPIFTERFVQQADVAQAALAVKVDQGDAARKIDELAAAVPATGNQARTESYVGDVLATADGQSNQRKHAQDEVISQITAAASARADAATRLVWAVGAGAAVLFGLVALLAIAVSRSIADPLRRLTSAATSVADLADTELVRVTDTEGDEEQKPQLATIDVASSDELGKLAEAFNRVQATASSLVERQALTRRNTSLMFANVAKRTQNLVGRQLALVDELERNEQDVRLLERLYRLDHLSTRLRRNADNLLVVSGTSDESRIAGPIDLSTALRSALAEIEDYQRVHLSVVAEILLNSAFGADLVLICAELLENATSFSPPGSVVEVRTAFDEDGSCVVSIVDHGIGMTKERLEEENRRLVERERLELAPTSVLGLFVVGRLARRHALTVDLAETPGSGVTARVRIPHSLFAHQTPRPLPTTGIPAPIEPAPASVPTPAPAPVEPVPVESVHIEPGPLATPTELPMPAIPALVVPAARQAQGFRWFRQTDQSAPGHIPSVGSRTQNATHNATTVLDEPVVEQRRGGLRRRVAGAQLPGAAAPAPAAASTPRHDPDAARDALDGFQEGFAKAAVVPAPAAPAPAKHAAPKPAAPPAPAAPSPPTMTAQPAQPLERGGLIRRVPGAQLAPGLRQQAAPRRHAKPVTSPSGAAWPRRDPDAERAAFDSFTAGLAKAAVRPDPMEESTK
ncbi:nitrate- and nitrite sensing domain-containing protein [Amycolatopsis sp. NPDC059021]|uniref:sensor histidine kinase n=1 Tax=Amycolatopsis sp. NPDC059021 TaxID=3346704 RepID=UPI00366DE9A7